MNNWQEFNFKESYRHLNNTIEVKLFNGKAVSIWNVVGGKILDKNGEEINTDNIGWFRSKKDWDRFRELQKFNKILTELDEDGDILDEIDWAINSSLRLKLDEKETEKLSKAFKTIRKYIFKAQEEIVTESKTYL
jgi:sulfur relay (sulfurtransferase) DsrC/TusE family protein